ncbi:MAG: MaoC/PaaZ C-terminal domain-containing protein [Ilumatobacter sp.]|nr:MaoC/PaaZ C-terminal domain-containing protein [Ilumatobacter sp.]
MNTTLEVAVGDELPAFVRDGTVEHWNRFAAVNDEFAAHHWDDDVANEEGFPAPFAMAPLQLAFFHAMLRDWIGDDGQIVSVNAKLKGPFFKEDTLTARARVTAITSVDDETLVDLELTQTDESGRAIATGAAQVALRKSHPAR